MPAVYSVYMGMTKKETLSSRSKLYEDNKGMAIVMDDKCPSQQWVRPPYNDRHCA